ncbi:MAG: TorF family putative porin [Rhodocyclaceae bacterium]|nr:TorF family putative porin [Rhodocyclaceae bacterium]
MKRSLLVCAVSTVGMFASAYASSPTPEHSFTGNVTLASEYLYRGIAQTRGKPAVQGGFDYAHKSGFYAGVWASNISWISDAVASASASLEIDVYGGYKAALSDDWGLDVGVLTYNYPGSGKPTGNARPDTTELYGAVSWKWLTLKYSHSTTSLFGWTKADGSKTKGSGYLELNASYDMGNGWTLLGHLGHQKVKGLSDASYSDFRVGVNKDLGFGTLGLAYSTTNAKDGCVGNMPASPTDVYCLVKHDGSSAYEGGKGRLVLTFGKTF